MTIRFLKQWNGYSPDAIVTLAGAEETRLVNLGFASFDLDGDAEAEFFVKGKNNPLTGGIQTIAKLTQAQYDAIAVKDDSTLYVIVA